MHLRPNPSGLRPGFTTAPALLCRPDFQRIKSNEQTAVRPSVMSTVAPLCSFVVVVKYCVATFYQADL